MRYPVITILACALSTSALADPPKPAAPKDDAVDALLQSAKPAAPGKSEALPKGGGESSPLKPKADNPQG
ncbi:MAG TPA: hypothetical protein VK986_23570, partial [Tepidisphaeraceae bacterium]|nr:hypothetical protein [Tepidisphaeraceae bacterium]